MNVLKVGLPQELSMDDKTIVQKSKNYYVNIIHEIQVFYMKVFYGKIYKKYEYWAQIDFL